MKMSRMGTLSLLVGLLVGASGVHASDCKGLPAAECQANSACRWINGYTRKDGREVAAYCRTGRAAKPVRFAAPPDSKSTIKH